MKEGRREGRHGWLAIVNLEPRMIALSYCGTQCAITLNTLLYKLKSAKFNSKYVRLGELVAQVDTELMAGCPEKQPSNHRNEMFNFVNLLLHCNITQCTFSLTLFLVIISFCIFLSHSDIVPLFLLLNL